MYGNQRGRPYGGLRPIRADAPLEGRRLWEVGSWGNASDHIGQRWESVGQESLRSLLGDGRPGDDDGTEERRKQGRHLWIGPRPPSALFLVDKPDLQAQFQSIGLTNPDALLLDREGEQILIRPIDFKWSLETASYRQISGDSLGELIAKTSSSLPQLVADSVGLARVESPTTRDGLFFSPDSRPNRLFLNSAANRQQEFPLEPKDVVFESVDGLAFFGALPWWPQARRLAELDRAVRGLDVLEGAERYYRLGSGVGGAIIKLRTSIFASDPPTLDVAPEVERTLQEHRFRSSLELLEHFRKLMEARNERLRRARELARCPYSFKEMLGDLARLGVSVSLEDADSRAEREKWGKLHRRIAELHRATVNAAGLELARETGSEAAALVAIEKRRPEFELKARVLGRRLIRQEVPRG